MDLTRSGEISICPTWMRPGDLRREASERPYGAKAQTAGVVKQPDLTEPSAEKKSGAIPESLHSLSYRRINRLPRFHIKRGQAAFAVFGLDILRAVHFAASERKC